jgi:hypothetical protein
MQKVSKTEEDLQLERQRQQEDKQMQAFQKSMEKEIKDNSLRVEWLKVKKELQELSIWYTGEAQKEKELTQNIVDTILEQFTLQSMKEDMYKFFKLPLPKIEVGNIEDKKEVEMEDITEIPKTE